MQTFVKSTSVGMAAVAVASVTSLDACDSLTTVVSGLKLNLKTDSVELLKKFREFQLDTKIDMYRNYGGPYPFAKEPSDVRTDEEQDESSPQISSFSLDSGSPFSRKDGTMRFNNEPVHPHTSVMKEVPSPSGIMSKNKVYAEEDGAAAVAEVATKFVFWRRIANEGIAQVLESIKDLKKQNELGSEFSPRWFESQVNKGEVKLGHVLLSYIMNKAPLVRLELICRDIENCADHGTLKITDEVFTFRFHEQESQHQQLLEEHQERVAVIASLLNRVEKSLLSSSLTLLPYSLQKITQRIDAELFIKLVSVRDGNDGSLADKETYEIAISEIMDKLFGKYVEKLGKRYVNGPTVLLRDDDEVASATEKAVTEMGDQQQGSPSSVMESPSTAAPSSLGEAASRPLVEVETDRKGEDVNVIQDSGRIQNFNDFIKNTFSPLLPVDFFGRLLIIGGSTSELTTTNQQAVATSSYSF